jgi:EmrB/QacA subfamily drug resistance transporter
MGLTEPSTTTRRWTVALASLAGVVMTLDINVVAIALPRIGADFDASLAGAQWTINAYALAFAALLLPAGSLSDRVGRRGVFGAGIAGFTATSLGCGLAPGIAWLVVFRALQGACGALVMATAVALIAGAYQGRARDQAIGIFSAAGGAAVAFGPTLGGMLVDGWGWRWIFLVNLPLGAAIVLGTVLVLREPETSRVASAPLDLSGAVLACAMLFSVNYALLAGPEDGWTRIGVLTALLAGLALLAAFLFLQRRRGDHALLDLRLFRIPSFSASMALSLCARVTTLGLMPFLILWLQGPLGSDPTEAGLRLLPMTILIMVGAWAAGRLQRRLTGGEVIAIGFALVGTGGLAWALTTPDGS